MIALDTSTVICLVELHEPARTALIDLLAHDGGGIVIVSTVSMVECLRTPMKAGDDELLRRYERFFASPDADVQSLTPSIARRAARVRAELGLKTPDAIHLATALERRADGFITTDRNDFARCIGRVPLTIHVLPRRPDQ